MVESSDGTLAPVADAGHLYAESDMRLMLLRHWTLYDALCFSPFVATRLEVWRDHGKQRLHELLALLGVKIEGQAKQVCIYGRGWVWW